MSLLSSRNTPMNYDERMKRADRVGVLAVAFYVVALIVVASFGPQMMAAAAPARRVAQHAVAAVGSLFDNVPLDAAFAAIIGVIVAVIGIAIREFRADEDRAVFDVR